MRSRGPPPGRDEGDRRHRDVRAARVRRPAPAQRRHPKTPEAEYVYKLWMAHGITAGRGVPFASPAFSESEKARSARNEITAPRMFTYRAAARRMGGDRSRRPEQAREWVRKAAATGIDGLKLNAYAARDHGGAPRRGEEARPRHDRAPEPAGRRADERARRRAARPRHGDAFLRDLRGALRRLRRAAVAAGPQLHRRAAPLRAGGAAVEPGPRAGQRGVEGAARRAASRWTSSSIPP